MIGLGANDLGTVSVPVDDDCVISGGTLGSVGTTEVGESDPLTGFFGCIFPFATAVIVAPAGCIFAFEAAVLVV